MLPQQFSPEIATSTVLVVDDNPSDLGLIRVILERAGYAVMVADSLQKMRIRLTQVIPETIVLDLRFPDSNLDDVLEVISDMSPACAVIVASSVLTDDLVEAVVRAGAAGVVQKIEDGRVWPGLLGALRVAAERQYPHRPLIQALMLIGFWRGYTAAMRDLVRKELCR